MAQEQETGNQRQRRNQSRRSQARLLHAPAYGFEEELTASGGFHCIRHVTPGGNFCRPIASTPKSNTVTTQRRYPFAVIIVERASSEPNTWAGFSFKPPQLAASFISNLRRLPLTLFGRSEGATSNVCFRGRSGHRRDARRCLLLTHNGHPLEFYQAFL